MATDSQAAAESSAVTEEREALELGLREWLRDDDATAAFRYVIEAGWRSPAEVATLCANRAADALERAAAVFRQSSSGGGADPPRRNLNPEVRYLCALAAEYRAGVR